MMSAQDTHNHVNDIRDALVAMNSGYFCGAAAISDLAPLDPRSVANVEI